MSDNSKISVIIPNYNHVKYIEQAIKTSLHQSVEPYEIIVIDDGSTDNSLEVLAALQEKYPKVQVLKNGTNKGCEYSMNRGVEASKGDYLVFRSADDITLPGFFEEASAMLDKHPEAALCCGDVLYFESAPENGSVERIFAASESVYMDPDTVSMALAGNNMNGASTMCRRSAFEKEGGFELKARWHCDWLLFMTLAFRHGVCYVPKPFAAFRLNPSSYNNAGTQRKEIQAEIFDFMIDHVCTKQRDLLPHFVRSAGFAIFGQKLLDHVFESEQLWRPEVMMLLQRNLYSWNQNVEEASAHIGMSGVVYEHLKKYQDIIEGHAKIAVYGAGEHTRLLLKHWDALKLPEIHAILTSERPQRTQYLGIPLISIEKAPEHEFDLVLISSKSYEPQLVENCRQTIPDATRLTFWG